MKQDTLEIQILSYLLEHKNIANLKDVLNNFLLNNQSILLQNSVSECRGEDCFKRLSSIIFAINKLQQDHQIILRRITQPIPQNNPTGINEPIVIGNTSPSLCNNGNITGDIETFLRDYCFSIISVSEDAEDYINRHGMSAEQYYAKKQICLACIATAIAVLTFILSLIHLVC